MDMLQRILISILLFSFSFQVEAQPPLRKLLFKHGAAPSCPTNSFAAAFITARGGFTSPQCTAIDNFFIAIEAAGITEVTDVPIFYLFADDNPSAAQFKWNAMQPVDDDGHYRATFVNGGTFNTTGYKRDGTTQYMNTHFSPASMSSTNAGVTLYVNEDVMEHGYDFYPYSATDYFYMQIYDYDLYGGFGTGSYLIHASFGTSKGSWSFNRTNATDFDAYRNSSTYNVTDASHAFGGGDLFLGAENFAGLPFNYTTKSYAAFSIHVYFDATKQAAWDAAQLNLLTAFGAN